MYSVRIRIFRPQCPQRIKPAKILKGEEEKQKEKSEGLQLFVKYKGLEELSYEVLHELIEVINFYDPEHIEIVWKYRDEFLEAIG